MGRKIFATLAELLFASPCPISTSFAKQPDEAKDVRDRLHNAGMVMQEALNIPDHIPQDLLDKARCVIVMPSVLKVAFVVGGSYGRGAMVCRTGPGTFRARGAHRRCMRLRAETSACS